MKEVYELWSFCIHSLRRTAPALAALVVLVVPAVLVAPAVLAVLVVPVVPVVLVVLEALVVPVVLAAPVVPRPWGPQNPALPRN